MQKKIKKLEPRQGRLLLSEPFLTDLHFKRSVILLTEHNEKGSLGFILNKPISLSINDAIEDFPAFDAPIFMGGPVKSDSLFFIHTAGERLHESTKVRNGLYWGGDFEHLKELVITNKILPCEIRFFVGYSGWGPEQLDHELNQQSWLVARGEVMEIMKETTSDLWKNLLKNMGTEYAILSNFPENPSLN